MKKYVFILILLVPCLSHAQETTTRDSTKNTDFLNQIHYGSNGFEMQSRDSAFSIRIQSRLQFRYAYPNDENPITFNDFDNEKRQVFKINRARIKVGGHGYKPWIKYYWEYELAGGVLLDFRMMIERWDFFKIKIGQWKVDFTRERTISSGAQQMVDRSILNRTFTIDRQQGIAFYGRVRKGKPGDFNYWLSVLTGSGRGSTENEDKHLMYVGKIQWNVFGRAVEMTGSDLQNRSRPDFSIGVAMMTTRGQYTRFSTTGGGQLTGYEETPGDYRINQALFESALKYRGFSWQHETHQKIINDRIEGTSNTLTGSYFQAGYFLHELIGFIPKKLEVAFRYSNQLIPTETRTLVKQEEFALAFNYFFSGHKNKLTLELARYQYENNTQDLYADKERIRVQWDISI